MSFWRVQRNFMKRIRRQIELRKAYLRACCFPWALSSESNSDSPLSVTTVIARNLPWKVTKAATSRILFRDGPVLLVLDVYYVLINISKNWHQICLL